MGHIFEIEPSGKMNAGMAFADHHVHGPDDDHDHHFEPVAGYTRSKRPETIETGDAEVDALIDGLLMNSIYTSGTEITYTFDLPTDFAGNTEYSALNEDLRARHLELFEHVSNLTGLRFVEIDQSKQNADLYFSFRDAGITAYVGGHRGGVVHVYNVKRDTVTPGGYADHLVLHEFGHGLGLRHAHDSDALPRDFQGHSWSVMSYRPNPGTETKAFATSHGPETFMLADIAALQYQFGANFDAFAGDTLYQVDFATGELLIDGAGQGAPNNKQMLRAIWDGAGTDTLDLANATQAVSVDLRPGEFTSFGDGFVSRQSRDMDGRQLYAEGNIANPYLYDGSTSSLLENATGGAFDDTLFGNQTSNSLRGGAGNDSLFGLQGADVLRGEAGHDLIVDGLGDTRASGGNGNDKVAGLSGRGTLDGNAGSDLVIGGIGSDSLKGGSGNDVLRGEARSNAWFGSDRLDGGTGNDVLMGGHGADVFVFRPGYGTDRIGSFELSQVSDRSGYKVTTTGADFEVGHDKIELHGFSGLTADNVLSRIHNSRDGARFEAEDTAIIFAGLDAGSLGADDFIFG